MIENEEAQPVVESESDSIAPAVVQVIADADAEALEKNGLAPEPESEAAIIDEHKPKLGRPSVFTEEIANTICGRISSGESLRQICKSDELPNASTVYAWLLDSDKKTFQDNYARARAAQAENLFEELLEIADDSTNDYMKKIIGNDVEIEVLNHENINRSRLRVDTRKWYISKVLPKKFGDKLDLTTAGEKLGTPILGAMPTEDEAPLIPPTSETDNGLFPDDGNEENIVAA